MGVLNVTPDSFSDGGQYLDPSTAIDHARAMLRDGADIIDIGGESTRPVTFRDNEPLNPEEEIARIIPVMRGLRQAIPGAIISVDTYKASVAAAALAAGASIINDVSAFSADPDMAALAASEKAAAILMHMPGLPRRLPTTIEYQDVVNDVRAHLSERYNYAVDAGLSPDAIAIDPGLGFGKTPQENLALLRRLKEFRSIGAYILVGPSRKSFIGAAMGDLDTAERQEGTAASIAVAIQSGADIVRVHDVDVMRRVVRMGDAIAGEKHLRT